jgi:hypothetical protein
MLIPNQSNVGGMGAFVTSARKGKGRVRATYKLKRVIRIRGDRRKIAGEVLSEFAVTADHNS